MARARLRARGCARGAAPDPRAPAAGQLAQAQEGARRLPAAPRRRVRRHQDSRRRSARSQPPAAASLAARALASCTAEELDGLLQGGPLPRLRARLSHLAESLRYEEAARLRDRIEALEKVVERLRRLDRLRGLELCLIAPALEPGWRKAFFVCGGASLRRSLATARARARGSRSRPGWRSVAPLAPAPKTTLTPEQAEDLMLLRRLRSPPATRAGRATARR